jgi:NADH-quinone oxidoreductase subunit N
VFMLGFAGLPLTGGFVGKLYAFTAAYDAGMIWLVIVGVLATAVSLYYYLGVIRALYMRAGPELGPVAVGGSPPRDALLHVAIGGALAVTVGSFFGVQPLVELARDAATALPF